MSIAELRSQIATATESFVESITSIIISSVHGMSLDELSALGTALPGAPARGRAVGATKPVKKAGKTGRLGRRSEEDIAAVVGEIVTLLKKNPGGMRAEDIRVALELQAKELPRPLADAISSKQIKKTGEKRATTYFVGAKAGGASKPAKKAAAKKSAKPAKAKAKSTKAKSKPAKASSPAVKASESTATANGVAG